VIADEPANGIHTCSRSIECTGPSAPGSIRTRQLLSSPTRT
jgi:hypothetical protein